MAGKRCRECGAQLRLRSTLCPLCGSDEAANKPKQNSPSAKSEKKIAPVEDYQADLRRLREELRALREQEAS